MNTRHTPSDLRNPPITCIQPVSFWLAGALWVRAGAPRSPRLPPIGRVREAAGAVTPGAYGDLTMPTYVVKVAPDEDRYVCWSTVTDSPHMWGDRAEVFDYLMETSELKPEFARPEIEKRFARADETGTSAFHGGGSWADSGFIVEQRGWLNRGHLGAFLDSFVQADESFDWSMLEPFEDDDAHPVSRIVT